MSMEIYPLHEGGEGDQAPLGRDAFTDAEMGPRLWATDAGDGWTAVARVVPGPEGHPAIIEFAFRTDRPDSPGLTARRLREFPFGEFSWALANWYRSAPDPTTTVDVHGQRTLVDPNDWVEVVTTSGFTDLDHLASTETRRGRPRLPEHEVLEVAVRYVKALRDPTASSSPVKAVAEEMEVEEIELVRSRINLARERGFLTRPPRRGVPGGDLTPKAIEMLNEIKHRHEEDES